MKAGAPAPNLCAQRTVNGCRLCFVYIVWLHKGHCLEEAIKYQLNRLLSVSNESISAVI